MVAEEDAHGGMAYGEVFMFALAAYIIERIRDLGKSEADIGVVYRRISLVGATACSVIIVIMAVMFARFANVCYLKAELMQQEAISYYTTLITRIEQTPGYTHDTPVAYIEPRSKNDDDFSGNRLFDPIYLPPFQNNSIINDFSWEKTMNMWCGFSRVEGEVPEGGAAEVAGMPAYPADGSIKMIDGVIVVKFAD